ncbi:MAG: hypothetical protein V1855_03075 [bacterium]
MNGLFFLRSVNLQKAYDVLWTSSKPALLNNNISIDPYLSDLHNDRRLGLTLLIKFENSTKFVISFRGLTASRDALMVQGFPDDRHENVLKKIRHHVREKMIQSHMVVRERHRST